MKIDSEDEEEELIGDESGVLKLTQINDDLNDKISLLYTYNFEIEEEQFEGHVEVGLQLGLTASK